MIVLLFVLFYQKREQPTLYSFPELTNFPDMPRNDSNPVTEEGAELGRHLFYDPILSKDSNRSCGSCHQQNKAFSGNLNEEGTKRDIRPLFNLAWHSAFGWDGSAQTIEQQVLETVPNRAEMNLPWEVAEKKIYQSKFYQSQFKAAFGEKAIDSILIAKALGQFLRTLLSYNSRYDKALRNEVRFTKKEMAGMELIMTQTKGNCLHCHTIDENPLGSSFEFHDNGLEAVSRLENYKDQGRGMVTGNKRDYGKFKTPSLRNIAITDPYMHDGRFKNLKQVLDFYDTSTHKTPNLSSMLHRDINLTEQEKGQIMAFLKTFTDTTFLQSEKFGSPFQN